MATIAVFDINKKKVSELELSDAVFNCEIKEYLIHEAVKIQLANRRAGTVGVKNRAAVSGSGKKPFKQKGTGQARQGCTRAPQYPGGGVAFGPQSKIYNLSMNKKARKSALRSALTLKIKENCITVIDSLDLPSISTKLFADVLKKFDFSKTLIVLDAQNVNLELSARNIKNVKVLKSDNLNLFDMLKYKNIVFSQASVRNVEGALQP